MKIVVALGNPGKKYEFTRHNAGFLALDDYLKAIQTISCESKFNAQICEQHQGSKKTLYVKPLTYMNDSGSAVAEIVNFYKIDRTKDLLVIHDEVDLPLGTIRVTKSSSSAGHNGVKDIIEKLGSQDFHRIRVGVDARKSKPDVDTLEYVLQKFSGEEIKKLQEEIFPKVKNEIEEFLISN